MNFIQANLSQRELNFKMINLIIILITMISCQEKTIEFYNLEKHSGTGFFDRGNLEGKKFFYKVF